MQLWGRRLQPQDPCLQGSLGIRRKRRWPWAEEKWTGSHHAAGAVGLLLRFQGGEVMALFLDLPSARTLMRRLIGAGAC